MASLSLFRGTLNLPPSIRNTFARILRQNSSTPMKMTRQVQLLPVIQPSELHPQGKIQLCKWRNGNYAGRYTGIIEPIPDPPEVIKEVIEEADEEPSVSHSHSAMILKNIAVDLLPSHLRPHLAHTDLCAVLMFDGPPDCEESIFIATLRSHELEKNNHEHPLYTREWFDLDKIPYSEMPHDDFHWYPKVLSGKKLKGSFVFGGIAELTIKSFFLEEVNEL